MSVSNRRSIINWFAADSISIEPGELERERKREVGQEEDEEEEEKGKEDEAKSETKWAHSAEDV